MRGIKDGWYAMEEDGNLVFGPVFQPRGLRAINTRSESIVTLAECNQLANVTSPAAASSSR